MEYFEIIPVFLYSLDRSVLEKNTLLYEMYEEILCVHFLDCKGG